ncbi:hypothetical protein H310_09107 [Aphanomyces invadans]|uniref:C2HC/C3H-type domain-containing protein n=1 Tax=Aphanomyces invadans TaxID=157072 RepID=A0A024TVU0_9STRA|nr:hypothetical protein H310_09107 [Aphanomyces invadans]ETV97741.1 hypothetical protein H310_09107 [Aphanomyces invadans]|eukprot:XP_008873302.1 hypothetical protein H310_09107 [Aphanomyces invadans]
MQKESKLRYDPSEHAKKQQAAKERAKELRDARSRGVVSDACTFAPKVNPRKTTDDNNEPQQSAPPGSPPIRSKFQSTQQPPSPTIKSKFHNQQVEQTSPRSESPPPSSPPKRRAASNVKRSNQPPKMQPNDSSDSLDRLSGSYSRQTSSKTKETYQPYESEEPEHDTLSNELKTRTGKVIARETKPNFAKGGGGDTCTRNSSCRCRQCDPSSAVETAPAPLARQRTMKQNPSVVADSSFTVDQNSLSLLKSKMSRRKSRSAPTKPASMFIDDDKPRHVVHSAREPPAMPQALAVPEKRRPPPPVAAFEPPPSVFDGVPDGDSEVQDDGANHECPDCHRKFNATAIIKHQKICKKVFQGPKKVFNMAAARLKGTDVEKMLQEKGISIKAATSAAAQTKTKNDEAAAKKADWKKKSSAFRDAIKGSRDYEQAKKEGRELPPPKPAEIDPSLVQCAYCLRRFNEKAAERHIPHCKEKAERSAMAGGPKKAAGKASAPPAKLAPPKPVAKAPAKKK